MIDREERDLLLMLTVLHKVSFLSWVFSELSDLLILREAMRNPEMNEKTRAKISIIIMLYIKIPNSHLSFVKEIHLSNLSIKSIAFIIVFNR